MSRRPLILMLCAALAVGGTAVDAVAQQQADRSAERAARRQQQQLQALQQQMTQAQAEKAQAEEAKAALAKQLQARDATAARASAAQRAAAERLKALDDEKTALLARVAELEQAAQVQKQALADERAARERDRQLATQALQAQTADGAQWQQRFGDQVRLVTQCTDRNERLLKVSAELLDRWQRKGPWDALRQREPVLGLGDVTMFNQVQDYRDKIDAERFVPRVEPR